MEEANIRSVINQSIETYESKLSKDRIIHENMTKSEGNSKSTNHWAEWSLKPHTVDEIREKCLTDFDNVCFTYLCEVSKIPEDFVLELAALSTGLMNNDNYKEYNKKLQKVLMYKYGLIDVPYEELAWYIKVLNDKARVDKKLTEEQIENAKGAIFDRLDWGGLTATNNFSEEFLDKFHNYIVWKFLPVNRKYTRGFKEKYKGCIPKRAENTKPAY